MVNEKSEQSRQTFFFLLFFFHRDDDELASLQTTIQVRKCRGRKDINAGIYTNREYGMKIQKRNEQGQSKGGGSDRAPTAKEGGQEKKKTSSSLLKRTGVVPVAEEVVARQVRALIGVPTVAVAC